MRHFENHFGVIGGTLRTIVVRSNQEFCVFCLSLSQPEPTDTLNSFFVIRGETEGVQEETSWLPQESFVQVRRLCNGLIVS